MEYKPWPLLILAFFHFIEPCTKIGFYSVYFSVNPVDVLIIEYNASSALQFFEYFFLFPIAGIALFAVKKWSFPVFISVEAWVVLTNLSYFKELFVTSQFLLLAFFIFFLVLNVVVVSYLLLPAVRIAYLDPRIRWWEAKPRYSVSSEVKIGDHVAGNIKNISESGVFIASHDVLMIDSEVELEFSIIAQEQVFDCALNAMIVHKFAIDGLEGYGARFAKMNVHDRRHIHSMIKCLDKSHVERRPPRRGIKDLIHWLATLMKSGKGLFPQDELSNVRKSGSS